MAKKTVKKQPLKAVAKAAVKTVAKTVAKAAKKIVKKATEPSKAKAVKTAPKKVEKVAKVKMAPVAKKTEEKKTKVVAAPEKMKMPTTLSAKGKVKELKETPETEVEADAGVEDATAAPQKVDIEKPKKKTAAQKKKEKLEIDANVKWGDLFEKYKQLKPVNYSMKDVFEANQPIQHKVLGWGWVISSENDRLEVLFKDGKKILISNYKS